MSAPIVLVADDSPVVRAVLRRQLEEHDYTVVEAANGREAVQRCTDSAPDIVLLDVEMPVLDGRATLQELKASPALCDIPVVFLTGLSGTADVVDGLRLGAHDYLRKPFDPAELLARVAAAVRVKLLQDELRRASRTDALTGINNRRHLDEELRIRLSAGRRHHHPVSVLMIDIDHFKAVNDTFGHERGDDVLREVAVRLSTDRRNEDTVGRWGGEEFLVILDNIPPDGAAIVAERIRVRVAAPPIPGPTPVAVTISVGCATTVDDTAEVLVRQADAALYEAKHRGRNRVMSAPHEDLHWRR